MPDKNAIWDIRKWESEWWTENWMSYLKFVNHFHDYKPATLSEDKDEGIDWWVQFEEGGEWVPIQFKLRANGRRDCPISIRQPYYGCDVAFGTDPKSGLNVLGRDYRGLMKGKAKYNYVAVKSCEGGPYDQIYRMESEVLKPIVLEMENAWQNQKRSVEMENFGGEGAYELRNPFYAYREDKLTQNIVSRMFGWTTLFSGRKGEIGLLKNKSENFRKIGCYVKESFKMTDYVLIPENVGIGVRARFDKVKQQRIKNESSS